jgi:hypothetical protein
MRPSTLPSPQGVLRRHTGNGRFGEVRQEDVEDDRQVAQENVRSVKTLLTARGLTRNRCRYKEDITLSGVLQFHRITDARMGGENRANLEVFEALCGTDALRNVIVVSTGWEEEDAGTNGHLREEGLLRDFLTNAISRGCQYGRFLQRDFDHAWDIVSLLPGEGRALQIQTEMLHWGLLWNQTTAFKALTRRFADFLRRS